MRDGVRSDKVVVDEMKISEFGPAMLALVPRQQAFVMAILEAGNDDYTAAAVKVGYGNDNSL